jgi:hypothetical protein
MKKALLWAISILLLSQNPSHASDARVDSMGGLTLVATDESDDINPFTLGNPAGLALLAPQSRFDADAQWFKESYPPTSDLFHVYGTMSELNNDNVKYHGLMVFLNNNWAVQVDGDTLHTESQSDYSANIYTDDRYRELFRTAYNFGPFVLGGEVRPEQTSIVFKPYNINLSTNVTNGTGTETALTGTAGLLANLLGNDPKQSHLRIGGIVSSQLNPTQEINSLSVIYSGSTTLTLTDTFTDSNVLTWGPEIYFESSKNFQASVFGHFSNFNVSFEEDSSNPGALIGTSPFNAETGTLAIGAAVFKMTIPLTDSINLKGGGLVSAESADTSNFSPSGSANGGVSLNAWTAQAGVGFDDPQDYTLGIQANFEQITGNQGNASSVSMTNFFDYKICVGGERWLSKDWAMRLGVTYEDANNMGTAQQNQFLFPVYPGQHVTTTTIVAGIGYQDSHLKIDVNLSEAQPNLSDDDPREYGEIYGAQIATSLNF